jgi:hypothetical protein
VKHFDTIGDVHGEAGKLERLFRVLGYEKSPTGYGFGSYCHDAGCIHFTTFLPNAVYRPGLLPSFYYAAASRALAMSQMLEKPDPLNANVSRPGKSTM